MSDSFGRAAQVLAAAAAAASLAACGSDDVQGRNAADGRSTSMAPTTLPAAERGKGGPVRTDLAPLTKRFEALGEPVSAHWQSGTLGGDRAPGPSSYWLDAVVRVRPQTAASLQRRSDGAPTEQPPAVAADLRAELPPGQWLTGEDLNRAFATGGFAGQAFVNAEAATVVLLTMGGN